MSFVMTVICNYKSDNSGNSYRFPALYTESGIILSHVRYLARNRNKSQSWKRKNTSALKLFIEYINAQGNHLTSKRKSLKVTSILRGFVDALIHGSISINGNDPSGLYWKPKKLTYADELLKYINGYTDYLADENNNQKPINPYRNATVTEERLNWCAYHNKLQSIFLNHLNDIEGQGKNKYIREVVMPFAPVVDIYKEDIARFPEDKIDALLTSGFTPVITRNQDGSAEYHLNYRNICITMLMHYAGLRISEVLQLYISDILHDEKLDEALVRCYHPSQGASPKKGYKNRKDYLKTQYGLQPRTEIMQSNRQHLGWKDPLLTYKDLSFLALFRQGKAKEFWHCWLSYLKYQRADPPAYNNHPYAFTDTRGNPLSLKNFSKQHGAAVERIGLSCAKNMGTTEHGHRHSYGFYLAETLGWSQVWIQKAMHHKSHNSCLVYIQPSSSEVRNKLRNKEKELKEKTPNFVTESEEQTLQEKIKETHYD